MPCNCDYMEPSEHELNKKRVARLIVQLQEGLQIPVTKKYKKASEETYAESCDLNEGTKLLCKMLSKLSKTEEASLVYNGRNKAARDLADWWDEHQEADKQRLAKEKALKIKKKLRKSAISKLTSEERKSLGL